MAGPEYRLVTGRYAHVQSIAVFRALYLGDMLVAIPALRALRRGFPQAKITLISLPWARAIVDRFPEYFDDFFVFPGAPGLEETESSQREWPLFVEEGRRRRFDLVLQMHGDGVISNRVVAALDGGITAGFFRNGTLPPAGVFVPYPDAGKEIERNLSLVQALELDASDARLEFPVQASDEAQIDGLFAAAGGVPDACVCVHPGSKLLSRRWSPSRFAHVADYLAGRGMQVCLTGTDSERAVVNEVAARMTTPAINLAGRTSLGGLGALLRRASLLISNDTGVSHIAAALRVPSVIVACGSDVERWAPLDVELHRVLAHPVPCRPCTCEICPFEGHPCSAGVPVASVIEQCNALLARHAGYAR